MPDEDDPGADDPGTGAARDPGDAVPPGVAPTHPAPLTAEDRAVKWKLERLGGSEEPGVPQGRGETEGPEQPGR
jgi:hypothetical protein